MGHPYNEVIFRDKGVNELPGHKKTWKKLNCILLSARSQSRDYIL